MTHRIFLHITIRTTQKEKFHSRKREKPSANGTMLSS